MTPGLHATTVFVTLASVLSLSSCIMGDVWYTINVENRCEVTVEATVGSTSFEADPYTLGERDSLAIIPAGGTGEVGSMSGGGRVLETRTPGGAWGQSAPVGSKLLRSGGTIVVEGDACPAPPDRNLMDPVVARLDFLDGVQGVTLTDYASPEDGTQPELEGRVDHTMVVVAETDEEFVKALTSREVDWHSAELPEIPEELAIAVPIDTWTTSGAFDALVSRGSLWPSKVFVGDTSGVVVVVAHYLPAWELPD